MTRRSPSGRRAWGARAVFAFAWLGVLIMAFALAAIGISVAGGAVAWRHAMNAAAIYWLGWRLAVYAALGALYLGYWRPRLIAAQATRSDGGAAARDRLRRLERYLVIVLIAIEAANLPALVRWAAG